MEQAVMRSDKVQNELREWFAELKEAKQELAEIDSVADPVERAKRHMYTKDRIERIEMNIDRIMGRV